MAFVIGYRVSPKTSQRINFEFFLLISPFFFHLYLSLSCFFEAPISLFSVEVLLQTATSPIPPAQIAA